MTVQHGTRSGYTWHRCRCDTCRAAWADIQRRGRAARAARMADRNDLPHGSVSTYSNYGCRCAACVQAKWESNHRRPSRAKHQQ